MNSRTARRNEPSPKRINRSRHDSLIAWAECLATIAPPCLSSQALFSGDLAFDRVFGRYGTEEIRALNEWGPLFTVQEKVAKPTRIGTCRRWWLTLLPFSLFMSFRPTLLHHLRQALAASGGYDPSAALFSPATAATRGGFREPVRVIIPAATYCGSSQSSTITILKSGVYRLLRRA
jgi:hypothetical protein